jgi:hypothetical protein
MEHQEPQIQRGLSGIGDTGYGAFRKVHAWERREERGEDGRESGRDTD